MNKQTVIVCTCILIVFTLCAKTIVRLRIVSSHLENDQIQVLIDPGHGGVDGGAIGITGAVEKNINLDISKRVFDLFGMFGVSSELTRTTDLSLGEGAGTIRAQKNKDLRARVEAANKNPHATMLSIHLNSFPDPTCHGAQVFFSPISTSTELAKSVQATLKQGLDFTNNRVAKPAESGHYLLKHVKIPSVIIECGFLSNRVEESLLLNHEYQKRLAACIVQGYRNILK